MIKIRDNKGNEMKVEFDELPLSSDCICNELEGHDCSVPDYEYFETLTFECDKDLPFPTKNITFEELNETSSLFFEALENWNYDGLALIDFVKESVNSSHTYIEAYKEASEVSVTILEGSLYAIGKELFFNEWEDVNKQAMIDIEEFIRFDEYAVKKLAELDAKQFDFDRWYIVERF